MSMKQTELYSDWESELTYKGVKYVVHANYQWDYDFRGRSFVDIKEMKAYDLKTSEEIYIPEDFIERVAAIIQDAWEQYK